MNRLTSLWLLAAALALTALHPVTTTATEGSQGKRGNLVSATWLKQNLDNPRVVLMDASPPPMYMAQHIPGAQATSYMSYALELESVTAAEKRFQSWGISADSLLVIYDQGDPMWGARLFYDLQYHGFPVANMMLLDGGLAKWKETGGALTKDAPPKRNPGTFKVVRMDESLRTRLPEMLAMDGSDGKHKVVEALDADWHFGSTAWFDRGGHIPHGIMLPSKDFYNADKTFKSPAEIQRMLDYLGIQPEHHITTYCGGGVAAAVPYFALRYMLGYPNVKLFQESSKGWLRDDRGLPIWTYDAPYMLRDTHWVKTWGGRMLRTFDNPRISFLDIRSPDEFRFRHAQFSAHVPASVIRENLKSPEKLAPMLGKAGVHPGHEAVVISGAGLTPDAALTYLMLDHLGQQRISILTDELGRAAELGLAMNEENADPKRGPPSKPLAPVEFIAQPRPGNMITGAGQSQGIYPKVFIASGKNPPAHSPAGKVIHVPYTDLLNGNGTPKAAKDIWSILTKAGVPRYAELVSFADDPGEAAVNYVIFRLMGFPDVKVLVL